MIYDEEEEFNKLVIKQKELRSRNKKLQENLGISEIFSKLEIKKQNDYQEILEKAKLSIKLQICKHCNRKQEISDKEYLEHFRYSFPLPQFKCNCEQSIIEEKELERKLKEEQKKINLERFKNDVVKLLPKRFSECTFDNFIGFNEEKKQLKELSKSLFGLFLTGNTGTGKTHLSIAYLKKCLSYAYKNDIIKNFIFTEIPEIISDYYIDNKTFNKYKNCDILVIDDLGSESYKDWGESKIYELINYRYKELKQTIITSNLNLKELNNKIGDRTVSRIIEMCQKIEIKGEDYRLKLLKNKNSV